MTREELRKHCKKQIEHCEELARRDPIEQNLHRKVYEEHKLILELLEQEPKTGHWIMTGNYYTGAYGCIDYVECSCCHADSLEEGNYCPNCGAKMVESEEK